MDVFWVFQLWGVPPFLCIVGEQCPFEEHSKIDSILYDYFFFLHHFFQCEHHYTFKTSIE